MFIYEYTGTAGGIYCISAVNVLDGVLGIIANPERVTYNSTVHREDPTVQHPSSVLIPGM